MISVINTCMLFCVLFELVLLNNCVVILQTVSVRVYAIFT